MSIFLEREILGNGKFGESIFFMFGSKIMSSTDFEGTLAVKGVVLKLGSDDNSFVDFDFDFETLPFEDLLDLVRSFFSFLSESFNFLFLEGLSDLSSERFLFFFIFCALLRICFT